jgi:hypothetical protein
MGTRKTLPGNVTGALSRRDVLRAGGLIIPAALVVPAWLSRTAYAATTFDYYISPSGSDSNPGTSSQPWAITALNTKQSLYSGKRVGLLDGTYNVYSLFAAVSHDGYSPVLRINRRTIRSSATTPRPTRNTRRSMASC